MTLESVHTEAIEHVLSAIFPSGDTSLVRFLHFAPGAPVPAAALSVEIFVRRAEYITAILFIRRNGAPYLRAISVSELWKMVADFVKDNYRHLENIAFTRQLCKSYAQQVDAKAKHALAAALAFSPMFKPKNDLTLYPLLPIRVDASFETNRFFFLSAGDLSLRQVPACAGAVNYNASQFPPLEVSHSRHLPGVVSWLGVRSPLPLVSDKLASAILGAVALTPIPRERHLFSGRTNFGGRCTINHDSYTISTCPPLVPAMMHDIVLTQTDHAWLQVLDKLLDSNDKEARSQQRALEYFYRAWSLDPRERFPALCMSLDSLVAVENGHTKAAVAYVKEFVDHAIDEQRLRLLLRLRGAVIHGAAPDVYDSENYEKYYVEYETDPIRDLELIVAKCLRTAIFRGSLNYHPDPNADLIASLRARGKFPTSLDDRCIIADDV